MTQLRNLSTRKNSNDIPKGWRFITLEEVGSIVSGLTYSPTDIDENGTLVLRSSNIKDGVLEFNDNVYVNTNSLNFNSVQENDILICVRNGSKSLIGKNALISKEAEGVAFGAFMAVFRSSHSKYLFQLFDTDLYKNQVHKNLGATINSINGNDLKKFLFPLPSLPEEIKIVSTLSKWDQAISITQKLINELKLRNKGLAQQLLSGEKRLKGRQGEWEEYKISELFELANRHIEWDENQSCKLVSIRRRYGGIFFRGSFLARDIKVKKLKQILTDDFLISKRQVSHGAWAMVPKEFDGFLVSDEYDCLKIKSRDALNSHFWSYFIMQNYMTWHAFLDSIGVHIEKLIFHYRQFKKRIVRIPPLGEQMAIASVLSDAHKEMKLYQQQLDSLKEQKKGLMQKLLTGEIRTI